MKREANFNTLFNHWLKSVYRKSGAFELKQTQTDSLPFSSVVPHQIQALEAVRHSTLVYKIPDAGFQNPFDCFCLTQQPAYIVVYYASKRLFCLIPIDFFVQESKISKRRSLTSKRALELSTVSVAL